MTPEPISVQEHRHLLTRQRFLKELVRFGALAFAVAFLLPALALKSLSRPKEAIAKGDVLTYAQSIGGAHAGQVVKASDLAVNQAVQAFPQGKSGNEKNIVELVRIVEGSGADGLVAYSAICKHLGCTVATNLNQQGLIICPCHGSEYDPRQHAKVVRGPAPLPLPSLPITTSNGDQVTVNGPFSGPIGPQ